MKPALVALQSALETVDSRYRGKPFVVVLLTVNPSDVFQAEAQQIKQLAALGKVNVVAVGLGSEVSDAVLPLRVANPTIQNSVSCFESLVQVVGSMVNALSQTPG